MVEIATIRYRGVSSKLTTFDEPNTNNEKVHVMRVPFPYSDTTGRYASVNKHTLIHEMQKQISRHLYFRLKGVWESYVGSCDPIEWVKKEYENRSNIHMYTKAIFNGGLTRGNQDLREHPCDYAYGIHNQDDLHSALYYFIEIHLDETLQNLMRSSNWDTAYLLAIPETLLFYGSELNLP